MVSAMGRTAGHQERSNAALTTPDSSAIHGIKKMGRSTWEHKAHDERHSDSGQLQPWSPAWG